MPGTIAAVAHVGAIILHVPGQDSYKVSADVRVGHEGAPSPSSASAGVLARIRGILLVILLVVLLIGLGFGIVYGIGQAAGGISVDIAIFYGFLLVLVTVGVMAYIGRRRQRKAKAERAQQVPARSG